MKQKAKTPSQTGEIQPEDTKPRSSDRLWQQQRRRRYLTWAIVAALPPLLLGLGLLTIFPFFTVTTQTCQSCARYASTSSNLLLSSVKIKETKLSKWLDRYVPQDHEHKWNHWASANSNIFGGVMSRACGGLGRRYNRIYKEIFVLRESMLFSEQELSEQELAVFLKQLRRGGPEAIEKVRVALDAKISATNK
jgi:hypothetical protein